MAALDAELQSKLDRYRKLMLLTAEASNLPWQGNGERIQQIARESDELEVALTLGRAATPVPETYGLYWGAEELCSVWMVGTIDPWTFARAALDFLASELDCHTGFGPIQNLRAATYAFGPSVVNELFDLVSAMLVGLKAEHRRWEATTYDDSAECDVEIVAAPDGIDERFDEAPLVLCSASDDGAGLVTMGNLDQDAFIELGELIEARDKQARRVLFGELV